MKQRTRVFVAPDNAPFRRLNLGPDPNLIFNRIAVLANGRLARRVQQLIRFYAKPYQSANLLHLCNLLTSLGDAGASVRFWRFRGAKLFDLAAVMGVSHPMSMRTKGSTGKR